MLNSSIKFVKQKIQQFKQPRTAFWYIFMVIMLAMTWSGAKAVQANYELQRQISRLQQQNAVLQLQNENIALNNKYLDSDQYLDLAARQNLGLAAPGENVLLLPTSVAMKYVVQTATVAQAGSSAAAPKTQSRYMSNLEAWRDFILGRQIISDQ